MSETERMNFQNWADTSVLFWPILETSGAKIQTTYKCFWTIQKTMVGIKMVASKSEQPKQRANLSSLKSSKSTLVAQ